MLRWQLVGGLIISAPVLDLQSSLTFFTLSYLLLVSNCGKSFGEVVWECISVFTYNEFINLNFYF